MRIGCLQFAPQVGDTENNLNRADAVLSKANPDELDLLVLPELAFSGYNFKSLQDIQPFLEPSGSGITSLWARTMALKYNCIVTVGYPEKVDVSPKWPTGPEYYNSAIVVNEDGETIANYRKSFLYYTDQTWALEGNKGFYEGFIPGLGNTAIGICMDLNPYKFEAPWHAFEFAFHVLEMQSNLVILSMAWLTREDRRQFTRMPNEPDLETLTYWVTRLEPLIRSDNEDEIIIVFCNRTGIEDEATYAGTSAVIGVQDGEVKVYGLLGRGEKELLVVDTNKSPYGKLQYCPPEDGELPELAKLQKTASSTNSPAPGSKINGHTGASSGTQTPKDMKADEGQKQTNGSARLPAIVSPQTYHQANGTSGTTKKRPSAPIQLPATIDQSKTGGAVLSPGAESFGIPTPSAPSPTPMAMRPRLIIPESPPIQPHQYPPDYPISAASLRSEKSTQSFKSEDSEASIQTVRSNHRPPEESTPFPHSGAPLSGYPENSWSDEDTKRIYGGDVQIMQQFNDFSPTTTPFEDASPASPRFFWRPPENLIQTPPAHHHLNGWTPGTPIGKQAEPFPWEKITGDNQHFKKTVNGQPKANHNAVESLRNGRHSPQSNASSNGTTRSHRSGSTNGHSNSTASRSKKSSKAESKQGSQASKNDEKQPYRPFSPKSRNASRTGMNERSNSSLGERESAAVVAMHLEGISHRAESANSMRQTSHAETPAPNRPESPKSRNCSRNRNPEMEQSQSDPLTIPIAASPSLFRFATTTPEARNFYHQPMNVHNRSSSMTNVNGPARVSTPNSGSNVPRPASRTASRGRQPGPQPTTSNLQRSTSQDSTRNDRLHTRVSRRESNARSGAGSAQSGRRSSRSSSQQQDLSQFQRVEEIRCPNCPVHGEHSHSVSGSNRGDSPDQQQSDAEASNASSRSQSIASSADRNQEAPEPQTATRVSPEMQLAPFASGSSRAEEAKARSEYSSSVDTLQSLSYSERSPPTPSSFDPPTPKAMSFSMKNYTLDTNVNVDPSIANEVTPTNRFPEGDMSKSSEIPTSAA